MATLQYSSRKPWLLLFMWFLPQPINPPKHCFRQSLHSHVNKTPNFPDTSHAAKLYLDVEHFEVRLRALGHTAQAVPQ